MECLVDNNHDQTAEAFQEYKSHAADQDHLLSFDFFPGVGDFINAALKVDKEQIPQAIWNSEARLKATGSARVLINVIAHTVRWQISLQIASNPQKEPKITSATASSSTLS